MGLSNNISEFLIGKAKKHRIPLNASFELLPICNLNCKMCYIRSEWKDVEKEGGLIGIEQWLTLARQLKKMGTFYLLLTGGEIFIYPDFQRLYIELYKMGFAITLNTNATLIDTNVINWLKKFPPKCVSISLYGSNNEVYEKICGKKNMFTKVDTAIRLLRESGIAIELKTMLTPDNYKDLKQCWRYAKTLNVPYEVAVYAFPPKRKLSKTKQVRFEPCEAAECIFYRNKIMSTQREYSTEIVKFLRQYEATKNVPGKECSGLNCSAGNTSCWISWQGYMYSCAMLDFFRTYPLETGCQNAWENLKGKTDSIKLSSTCSHCDMRQVCTVCPASAYAETGSVDGTSAYHCEMTKKMIETMYQYVAENGIDINSFSLDEDNKE